MNNPDSLSAVTDEILNGPGSVPLLDPGAVVAAHDAADAAAAEAKRKAAEARAIAQEKANQAVAAGGPSFVFNEEQINTVIHQLDDVIIPALKDARIKVIKILDTLSPPGEEYVSIQYVGNARTSMSSYLDYVTDEIEKLTVKSEAFKEARDAYLKQDSDSRESLKK